MEILTVTWLLQIWLQVRWILWTTAAKIELLNICLFVGVSDWRLCLCLHITRPCRQHQYSCCGYGKDNVMSVLHSSPPRSLNASRWPLVWVGGSGRGLGKGVDQNSIEVKKQHSSPPPPSPLRCFSLHLSFVCINVSWIGHLTRFLHKQVCLLNFYLAFITIKTSK